MTTRYIADDVSAIKSRMEEIIAERTKAIMGKPIEEAHVYQLYGTYTAMDYKPVDYDPA